MLSLRRLIRLLLLFKEVVVANYVNGFIHTGGRFDLLCVSKIMCDLDLKHIRFYNHYQNNNYI